MDQGIYHQQMLLTYFSLSAINEHLLNVISVPGVKRGGLRKYRKQNSGYQEVYSVVGMKGRRGHAGDSFTGLSINKYTSI